MSAPGAADDTVDKREESNHENTNKDDDEMKKWRGRDRIQTNGEQECQTEFTHTCDNLCI